MNLKDEMINGGWIRTPKFPRRYFKALGPPPDYHDTAKSRWLRRQTLRRFERSFPATLECISKCLRTGAFGQYSGFTIYETR